MRFAIYIRTVKSARGAERVTGNIALGLARLGHEIDFLVEEPGGQVYDQLSAAPGVTVLDLRLQPIGRINHYFWQWLACIRALVVNGHGDKATPWRLQLVRMLLKNDPPVAALRRYAHSRKPDVILSFLNYPNIALLLARPLLPKQTRVIVSVRNHISTSSKHTTSKWVRSVPNLMRRFFSRADRVVAPSRGVAEDVISITALPDTRINVIPNPVFRPELIDLAREPADHPWLIDKAAPVIVAAGKLKPQKDFATLLSAFALLRQSRPARLIILGEGPERAALEQQADKLGISGDLNLCGDRDNPYPYFANASVFVLSSAWEGLPNVLIEALACGCPVVATECPSGPAEILENGTWGPLVPVGDAAGLADAICTVLDSPPERERQIKRAQDFSADSVVQQYARMLESVSNNR